MGAGLSLLLCEQQWATRGQKEFRSVLLCYPLPSTHLGFSALPDQTIRRQASVILEHGMMGLFRWKGTLRERAKNFCPRTWPTCASTNLHP